MLYKHLCSKSLKFKNYTKLKFHEDVRISVYSISILLSDVGLYYRYRISLLLLVTFIVGKTSSKTEINSFDFQAKLNLWHLKLT